MAKTTAANQTKSTQNTLLINEVKDGVVVMSDGSLRAVILASAINFDLMSTQEQDAVEYSFQGFLNSLHFPVQIVIKSQKIDLDNYIAKLDAARGSQSNELLAALMDDYIANIKGLVEEVNIMAKRFYAVVPYFPPLAVSKTNIVANVGNLFKSTPVITVESADYERYKTELGQRVQQVTNGLLQMGIRAIPLSTQELVDLYYSSYNPDVAVSQRLIEANQFQGATVTRGGGPLSPPTQSAGQAAAEPATEIQTFHQTPAAPPAAAAPVQPAPAPAITNPIAAEAQAAIEPPTQPFDETQGQPPADGGLV